MWQMNCDNSKEAELHNILPMLWHVTCIGSNQKNQPNLDLHLVRRYTICHFPLVVLHLCISQNQKNQHNMVLYLVRRYKIFVSVATLHITIQILKKLNLSIRLSKTHSTPPPFCRWHHREGNSSAWRWFKRVSPKEPEQGSINLRKLWIMRVWVRNKRSTVYFNVQPEDIGWTTGNGKKISNSQACCLAQLCLAAA